ncbi:hypothetical protein [Halorarius halobius]|uniref:hypothetical protein n=1 Tax=Halorarius halobius TaxID=2962671 RepID=UPI0020CF4431|nr:hypothetical protein [Halorarius halobius]
MSPETPTHADAPTRSDTLATPSPGPRSLRLRALRHLRPQQVVVLAAVAVLAALVIAAPAGVTATVALLAATVTMLVAAPLLAVRAAAGLA